MPRSSSPQLAHMLLTAYCIGGFALVGRAIELHLHADWTAGFLCLAIFLGSALTSQGVDSDSRGTTAAAIIAGAASLGLGLLRGPEQSRFLEYSAFLMPVACICFAIAGKRLGAHLELARRARWLLCATAVLGACCVHVIAIQWLAQYDSKLATLIVFLVIPGTPVLVGALLQSQSRKSVRSSLALGLLALASAPTTLGLLNGSPFDEAMVVWFVLAFLALLAYGCALLGIRPVHRRKQQPQILMPMAVIQ